MLAFFNLLRLVSFGGVRVCLGHYILPIVGCQRSTETDGMLRENNILLEGDVLFHTFLEKKKN